jgi:hypothetical protein
MPTLTRPLSPLFAAALTVVCVDASAAGFGSGSSTTMLGQTLDFVVPVRVDAGEVVAPECVAAEVIVGERRVPPALVRTTVETVGAEQIRVRVLTSQAIDEPVVNVALSLGCPPKIARRFVVFAEPPATAAPPAVTPVMPTTVTPAGDAAGQAPAAPGTPASTPAPAPNPGMPAVTGDGASISAAPARAPAAAASRPGDRFVLRARPPGTTTAGPAPAPRPPRAAARPPRAAAPTQVARPAGPPVQPRLRLETAEPAPKPPQPDVIAQAMEAVAQAASAARAAEAAASAASGRIATLERTVEQMRNEARSNAEQSTQLRQRLAASEETSRWMLPLGAAVLVLGALAGWLGWRLSVLQRERRADWRAPAASPATGTSAAAPDSTHLNAPTTSFVTVPAVGNAPAGARWHRGTPAWPPPAVTPVDPWVSSDLGQTEAGVQPESRAETTKTQPLPPMGSLGPHDEGAPRDVTIEELIDLEQQAEFFVVLGQDEAAIDLLMEHLRSTGGGSPLPYLKLLEIYRRRGDREAYERTRTRFNHRFNAYAPEWGADLAAGRSLDDYAGVVPRLQQVWPRPLDAMAELEALLFRKSRGELFDLPAYREVLLLYSLARDLLDRKSAETGNVDFLLPMSGAEPASTEFGATAPVPYLGLESDSVLHRDEAERPTKPLDFDVSRSPGSTLGGPARPSLFGDLDPPTSPGHQRRS